MISYISGETVELAGLPQDMKIYLIDADHHYEQQEIKTNGFVLQDNQVCFLKNEQGQKERNG